MSRTMPTVGGSWVRSLHEAGGGWGRAGGSVPKHPVWQRGWGGRFFWRGSGWFDRAQTTQWLVVSHVSLEQRVCDEIYKVRMPVLWLDVVSLSESKLLL